MSEQVVVSAPGARRWWALAVLCLSVLLVVVDNTIVNVALPTLSRELNASTSDLQWFVDAYTLLFAGLLLTGGGLGDRWDASPCCRRTGDVRADLAVGRFLIEHG